MLSSELELIVITQLNMYYNCHFFFCSMSMFMFLHMDGVYLIQIMESLYPESITYFPPSMLLSQNTTGPDKSSPLMLKGYVRFTAGPLTTIFSPKSCHITTLEGLKEVFEIDFKEQCWTVKPCPSPDWRPALLNMVDEHIPLTVHLKFSSQDFYRFLVSAPGLLGL